jgi:hypothetical protein
MSATFDQVCGNFEQRHDSGEFQLLKG